GPLGEGLMKVRTAVVTLDRAAELRRSRNYGIDRYYWPIGALLALLAVEPLLGTRRKQSGS
ncbi:MAG TPA: hypothetical protein VMJ12_16835, partial [Candidatus Acidoferrales bacterium]|nr:hypothetical protein [Candidatus Acidoferrales bacterium]